jgi:hypothetical protein
MTQKQLSIPDIHGSDPLANLLFKRLMLKPYILAAFFVLIGFIYAFALPKLWGREPASDPISLLNIVLVFPVAGYFYAYQPTSILRVYNSVNRFLRTEGEQHEPPYEKIGAWHARPHWWLAGMFIGGASTVFGFLSAQEQFGQFWYNANWMQIFIVEFTRFLAMSMIGVIIARHIAASMTLNTLFQRAQFPLTLDADRIEVFNAVKKFSLEIVGVAAIIGLNLGLQPLIFVPPMPEYAFYVILYFILAPVAFFLPLWEVHRRMVYIKEQMLEKLHLDYQEESYRLFSNIHKDTHRDPSNPYLKDSESLSSIKKAIELINQSPDWPFEGTLFYRLAVTVLSPFILAIWDAITNAINNIIIK